LLAIHQLKSKLLKSAVNGCMSVIFQPFRRRAGMVFIIPAASFMSLPAVNKLKELKTKAAAYQ
jgi:hypothetical protein